MEPYTKKKTLLLVGLLSLGGGTIIITIFLLGGIIPSSLFTSYSLHMPGMMGTNMNGMQNMMTTQGQPVSVQQAIQMMHNTTSYAKVISHNNTIIFGSKNTNVVALAMGRDTAINLTAIQPPSYSKGDVFVIDGLINPTLIIPKGTSVQFTIINLDVDMNHNLAISSVSPPYPYTATMSSMNGMMSFLPPTNQGSAHEYSYTLTLDQSGNLWYLCTYPSHAQDGMYGKILVTGWLFERSIIPTRRTIALTNTPSNGYLGITSSTGSLIISLSADFTQADVHDNQTYPAITFSLPQGVRSMAADSGYDDHKLYDFRGFKLVCPVSEIYNHTSSDSFRGLVWQLHEFRITRINQSLRLKYLVVSTLEVNGISTFPT